MTLALLKAFLRVALMALWPFAVAALFPAYSFSARRGSAPTSVSVSGTVTIGGTLTCTATGATSYQWRRAATWDGGGSYSDIGSATSSTYTPVSADIGYDICCVATNSYGSTTSSNSLRYDPTTVSAVIDVWKIRTLSAGSLSSWVGAKSGNTFSASGSNRPTVGATAFNSTVGVTFDGSDDIMSCSLNLSSYNSVRIVVGLIDTTVSTSIVWEHGSPNWASLDGGFLVASNASGAAAYDILVGTRGLSNGQGLAYYVDTLATAAYWSVAPDSTTADGVKFIRKSGTAQTKTDLATACATVALANTTSYIGARSGGSLPWAGTMGGALMLMSGNAQDSDLSDAEAYVKNGGGL